MTGPSNISGVMSNGNRLAMLVTARSRRRDGTPKIADLDIVALNTDLPEYGLNKGAIGP